MGAAVEVETRSVGQLMERLARVGEQEARRGISGNFTRFHQTLLTMRQASISFKVEDMGGDVAIFASPEALRPGQHDFFAIGIRREQEDTPEEQFAIRLIHFTQQADGSLDPIPDVAPTGFNLVTRADLLGRMVYSQMIADGTVVGAQQQAPFTPADFMQLQQELRGIPTADIRQPTKESAGNKGEDALFLRYYPQFAEFLETTTARIGLSREWHASDREDIEQEAALVLFEILQEFSQATSSGAPIVSEAALVATVRKELPIRLQERIMKRAGSVSLDVAVSEDTETTLYNFLPAPAGGSQQHKEIGESEERKIAAALEKIPPMERAVLTWEFGFGEQEPLTRAEIQRRLVNEFGLNLSLTGPGITNIIRRAGRMMESVIEQMYADAAQMRQLIEGVMDEAGLTPVQRRVIQLRWGFNPNERVYTIGDAVKIIGDEKLTSGQYPDVRKEELDAMIQLWEILPVEVHQKLLHFFRDVQIREPEVVDRLYQEFQVYQRALNEDTAFLDVARAIIAINNTKRHQRKPGPFAVEISKMGADVIESLSEIDRQFVAVRQLPGGVNLTAEQLARILHISPNQARQAEIRIRKIAAGEARVTSIEKGRANEQRVLDFFPPYPGELNTADVMRLLGDRGLSETLKILDRLLADGRIVQVSPVRSKSPTIFRRPRPEE